MNGYIALKTLRSERAQGRHRYLPKPEDPDAQPIRVSPYLYVVALPGSNDEVDRAHEGE